MKLLDILSTDSYSYKKIFTVLGVGVLNKRGLPEMLPPGLRPVILVPSLRHTP